jgi:serine/threonine protein kinase
MRLMMMMRVGGCCCAVSAASLLVFIITTTTISILTHSFSCAGDNTYLKIIAAKKLLEAVDSLHARGVMHGDLKPENILLIRRASGDIDSVRLGDVSS